MIEAKVGDREGRRREGWRDGEGERQRQRETERQRQREIEIDLKVLCFGGRAHKLRIQGVSRSWKGARKGRCSLPTDFVCLTSRTIKINYICYALSHIVCGNLLQQ